MPPTPRERVAVAIRAAMNDKGRTGTDLAGAIGLSQAAVSRRLNGEVPFDVDELAAVAEFLGVPVSSLVSAA